MNIRRCNFMFLKWLTFFTIIFIFFPIKAHSLDQDTKVLCNKVIMKVFNDIVLDKVKYIELSDFDQKALAINSYGIYTIRYKSKEVISGGKKQIFEFGLTMVGLNEKQVFGSTPSKFDLGFPLLELRFSGFQNRTPGTRKFDLQGLVQKYGQELWDYQQKYMPYQLKLSAVKNEYKVGENIDFKVTLTNRSQKNFMLKDMSSNTLFFLYNNKTWGAKEVNPAEVEDKQIFLKAGQSVEKIFRGPPIQSPQEFEIYVSYGFTYQGVKAADSLKVRVVQ